MKSFQQIFYLAIGATLFLTACVEEVPGPGSQTHKEGIQGIVVPESHDLSSVQSQPAQFTLGADARTSLANIRVYQRHNGNQTLIYQGAIDKAKPIVQNFNVPNHIQALYVWAQMSTGVHEWTVSPSELSHFVLQEKAIEYEEASASGARMTAVSPYEKPVFDCDQFEDFDGKAGGRYRINTSTSQGINVNKDTEIYICAGSSWSPAYINGNTKKLKIYVAEGAGLNLNTGNMEAEIYNMGNLQATHLSVGSKGYLYNWAEVDITGSLNVNGNIQHYDGSFDVAGNVNINGKGQMDNNGSHFGGTVMNIGGHLNISEHFYNKDNSTLNVSGNINVNGSAEFKNYCKVSVSGSFTNNNLVSLNTGSYTEVTGAWRNNGGADHTVQEGSVLITNTIESNAHIYGADAFSIVKTGTIRFNGNSEFRGNLDICSSAYETSMGDEDVISTCSTYIPITACNEGFNAMTDADGDGVAEGVDVDDSNPNVVAYYYPQGENHFYTGVYEDLWPCLGDYDFNDVVHYYSYRESLGSTATQDETEVTALQFTYQFPALGGALNNSLVLRVIDTDNDAELSLLNETYSAENIERKHDDANGTTLFVLHNIKSLYTDNVQALINTSRQNFSEYPEVRGEVTGIEGAYDEFLLIDGQADYELHPLSAGQYAQFTALNQPSSFNTNRFNECADASSGGLLYRTANGLPWAIYDIPVPWKWPKERTALTDAYPNFVEFATGSAQLDWYSDQNNNQVQENIFQAED